MRLVAAIAALAVVGLGAFYYVATLDSELVRACEKRLVDRLRAPSGYKRIEVRETVTPLDADAYWVASTRMGHSVEPYERELIEQGSFEPVLWAVELSYDAPNGFNALIRSSALCEYLGLDGKPDRVLDSLMRFNGQTILQELQELAREGQG